MKTSAVAVSALVLGLVTGPVAAQELDAELAASAAEAAARGCDLLDPAHCLYPFPSDHFTTVAPAGSPQSKEMGGTGRRIAFPLLAMPRNTFGKPIDPTEWNRNDGFSPGQMIVTYVPGLDLAKTYGRPVAELGVADVRKSLPSEFPNPPVLVLRVQEDASGVITGATPHLVWAEPDANAGTLLRSGADYGDLVVDRPTAPRSALFVRPAVNFDEGRRYVVVLRNLEDASGSAIAAPAAFRVCRDPALSSLLPPVNDRCAALESRVFPVLEKAGIARDASLYLAWDFTVASTKNQVGRLRAMRDDGFSSLSSAPAAEDCTRHVDGNGCRAPAFTIDTMITDGLKEGIAKQIHGTLTVPSYVVPVDPSPLEEPAVQAGLFELERTFPDDFEDVFGGASIVLGASAPPNRLFYDPSDAPNPNDPLGSVWGDGLPDRTGEMKTRFVCQIPSQASSSNRARAGIYGHGLLDQRIAITYDGVPELSREHNFLFCAVDWFGFATGDLGNVASTLFDLSNFAVLPDGSQQGMINFAFLARLLVHPDGLASRPEFRDGGGPVFDRSEVFYDGNSQGGILGGAVIAISKDVNRGVLGSLGMNYSTLLRRSVDFDLYSVPLYLAYTDELDRNVLFSLIQMLWDRGENDGYAHHLTDNSALGGPDNVVLLHPQFGDHQVTMWSADVMARTMRTPADFRMTESVGAALGQPDRHPDLVPHYGMPALDYGDPALSAGSAIILWDDSRTEIPPVADLPPRVGRDPHDDSAKKVSGRCQKSHFLRTDGRLIDVLPIERDGAACPAS